MGRYTLCPFYLYHRNTIISCEDVWHQFETKTDADAWLDRYCDHEWEQCPYAEALLLAYKEGDERVEEHTIEAMREEMRRLSSLLGRAEKRVQSRDEEIRKLREKNKRLEDIRRETYGRYRKMQTEYEKMEKTFSTDFHKIAAMYEDRIAYLLDTFTDGRLREADVEAWAEGKEYCLTYEGSESDERVWIVVKKGEPDVLQETE